MTKNRKGRSSWHQETPKAFKRTSNSTDFTARIKAAVVTLALWGLLPMTVADWIIHQGGLSDD